MPPLGEEAIESSHERGVQTMKLNGDHSHPGIFQAFLGISDGTDILLDFERTRNTSPLGSLRHLKQTGYNVVVTTRLDA